MSIEHTIDEFISGTKPGAIVLQGTWGRGKTHLWRTLLEKYRASTRPAETGSTRRYSYVSLFGVNSLDELKLTIFQNAESLSREPATKILGILPRPSALRRASQSDLVPTVAEGHFKGSAALYRAYAFSKVRDMLVCLDDIERRGAGLRLLDVMGCISMLSEQRGCRVMVILNNQSFEAPDLATWERNREKVFQNEITFAPSASKCADIVFPGAQKTISRAAAKAALISLDCTNIRIIEKVRYFLDNVESNLAGQIVPADTWEGIARGLTLLTFCWNGSGEGAPPMDYVLEHSVYGSIFADKDSDKRTEEQKGWDDVLARFGYDANRHDDRALIQLVRTGVSNRELLLNLVEVRNKSLETQQFEDSYRHGWDLWHDSFADNREEVVEAFRLNFPPAAHLISSINADGTVRLMRELGEEQLADELVDVWVRRNSEANREALAPVRTGDKIHDERLRRAMVLAYDKTHASVPLGNAMAILSSGEGKHKEAVAAIAIAEIVDLVAYMKSHPAGESQVVVDRVLAMPGKSDMYTVAKAKLTHAVRAIAAESDFQRLRMFGKFSRLFSPDT